jgi:hypothetical protein
LGGNRAEGARRSTGKKTKFAFFDRDRRCRRRLKRRKVGGETRRRREIRARRGRRGARDRLAGAGSSRRLGGRTGNAAYSPDQSVRSTARSSPARPIGEVEVFGSVSKTARLGAWAAVFGAGTRARCEFGQRPRSVSSRVAATEATRRRYRGRDRGNTDLRGSRGRRPRCSPCPFGSSRAVALRRGGGVGQSRKGRRKYKTM